MAYSKVHITEFCGRVKRNREKPSGTVTFRDFDQELPRRIRIYLSNDI
jgi:hypothetical protein